MMILFQLTGQKLMRLMKIPKTKNQTLAKAIVMKKILMMKSQVMKIKLKSKMMFSITKMKTNKFLMKISSLRKEKRKLRWKN